jgi:RNA methyltransferase, TrmH family
MPPLPGLNDPAMLSYSNIIASTQNSWVKSVRGLHDRSERYRQLKFLIEGTHLVEEALANEWPLDVLCFDMDWAEQNEHLLQRLLSKRIYQDIVLQPVSREILAKLSTTDTVCSVVGVARMVLSQETQGTAVARNNATFYLATESLQDPGNCGALIRTTAATGPIVLSSHSVDPTNPKVLRSSAGQWFRNPPWMLDLLPWVQSKNRDGFQILAAVADGDSMWSSDLTVPTVILLGNEGAGLSADLLAESTGRIAVPMSNGVESLNVSLTGALLAYEHKRQTR